MCQADCSRKGAVVALQTLPWRPHGAGDGELLSTTSARHLLMSSKLPRFHGFWYKRSCGTNQRKDLKLGASVVEAWVSAGPDIRSELPATSVC